VAQTTATWGEGTFRPSNEGIFRPSNDGWLAPAPVASTAIARAGANVHPATLEIQHLLSAWRAAELRLDSLLAAGAETALVRAEIASLRARHHKLFDQRASQTAESLTRR